MADDLLEGLVKQFRLSDEEFWALTETEEGCERILTRLRWPSGFVCPHCRHGGWQLDARRYECSNKKACGRRTSLTSGTIFHRTRKPLTLWFLAARCVIEWGANASELQRQLKVSYERVAGRGKGLDAGGDGGGVNRSPLYQAEGLDVRSVGAGGGPLPSADTHRAGPWTKVLNMHGLNREHRFTGFERMVGSMKRQSTRPTALDPHYLGLLPVLELQDPRGSNQRGRHDS